MQEAALAGQAKSCVPSVLVCVIQHLETIHALANFENNPQSYIYTILQYSYRLSLYSYSLSRYHDAACTGA